MSEEELKALYDEGFIETTVETKLNWFIHDMVSYEIDLSTIERIIKVVALMYCIPSEKINQMLLYAKSKCEERIEYGISNQISGTAALNEESENHSFLLEKEMKVRFVVLNVFRVQMSQMNMLSISSKRRKSKFIYKICIVCKELGKTH